MDLALPVSNLELALWHADRLRAFESPDPHAVISSVMQAELPDGFASGMITGVGPYPRAVWCGSRQRKVIYIDGCRSLSQAVPFIAGYDNGVGVANLSGVNLYLRDAVAAYTNALRTTHFGSPEFVDIVGYSLGGTIATRWAYDLHQAASTWKRKIFTYGAPRALAQAFCGAVSTTPIVRMMCNDDPVPLIPPRITDVPALNLVNSVRTNLVWGNYVHTGGGVLIYPNGNLADGPLPADASIAATSAFAAWLVGFTGEANGPHSLQTYTSRMRRRVEIDASKRDQRLDLSPREEAEPKNKRERTERQNQVIANLHRQGDAANNRPISIPVVRQWKYRRVNGVHQVIFNGRVVSLHHTRKGAMGAVRDGNNLMRRLQRMAFVSDGALLESMTDYLQAATDVAGEFVPAMNDELTL